MSDLALVTGAAGGIGAAVARRLIRRGYDVIAVERTAELAEAAVAGIGRRAVPVAGDLGDRAAVRDLCARIEGEWADRLSVVVANAGVIAPSDLAEADPDELDATLDVNLHSAVQIARSSLRAFLPRDRGHLLATVSMGGIIALPGSAAYSASKAGLRALLAAVNAEVAGTDVRVSGIYPSAVDTPMLRHEARHGGSPLNFVGTVFSVDDVADAYETALDTGRLEVFVPLGDSVTSRLLMLRPGLVPRLLPRLDRVGERGRARFLARIGDG